MTIKVAVFGYKDSLVGQVLEMLKKDSAYSVECFLSANQLPSLSIELEHDSRPNRKTEFPDNGMIFGKKIYVGLDYIKTLSELKINKVFLLEDDKILRSEIYDVLKKNNVEVLSFIHPSVYIGGHNTIKDGVIIFPNCYLGYKSDVGTCTIVQSNSVIEHHNSVGDFVNINPRLTTGGFTSIGNFAEINLSVDIINRISVGNSARVGAGSLVLENCDSGYLYFGRPAKKIRRV